MDIALFLGIYSSILATILGIVEIRNQRRKIDFFLEHFIWQGEFQITIVNIGHRPITLIGMRMFIDGKLVESNELLKSGVFPILLEDGKHISIPLSDVMNKRFFDMEVPNSKNPYKQKVNIGIFDVDDHLYRKYRFRELDTKWTAAKFRKKGVLLG